MQPTQNTLVADSRTWLDHMPAYLSHLRGKKRSPRTLQLREYQVRRFFQKTELLPAEVTIDHLRAFMDNPDWKPATCQVVKSSLCSFFGFLYDEEILPANASKRLESPRVGGAKPKPASDEAVANALAKASPRVKLMVQLGILIGLRSMEIAAVNTADVSIDERGASLTVFGKGAKTRVIPISDETAELIIYQPEGYLFPGRIDGHISPAYVSRLVSRVLPPGVTCHKLRHRFASRAYKNSGNDLRAVQMLLGHANISTTEFYVEVADDSLRFAALSAA